MAVLVPSGSRITMNPPPPMLPAVGWVTPSAKRDGDGGVDRVAAALQDGEADVAGVGLGAGDGALPAGGDALVLIVRRRAADGCGLTSPMTPPATGDSPD